MIVDGFEPVAHGLPPDCFLDRDEDAPDLFAVWTRGENAAAYVERSPFAPPSDYRTATVVGMPAVVP